MPTKGSWVYVINLSRVYWGRRTNRADRAIRLIRKFIARHTKADRVLIMNDVNEYVWRRSREKPPRRVKVLVTISEEEGEEGKQRIAVVRLAGEKLKPGHYTPRSGGEQKAESKG